MAQTGYWLINAVFWYAGLEAMSGVFGMFWWLPFFGYWQFVHDSMMAMVGTFQPTEFDVNDSPLSDSLSNVGDTLEETIGWFGELE